MRKVHSFFLYVLFMIISPNETAAGASLSSSSSKVLQSFLVYKLLENNKIPLIQTIPSSSSSSSSSSSLRMKRSLCLLTKLHGGVNRSFRPDPLYEDRIRGELYEEIRYDQNRYKRLLLRVSKHMLRFGLQLLPLVLPEHRIPFGSAKKWSKHTEFAFKMAFLVSLYDAFWSSSSSLYVYICFSVMFSVLSMVGVHKIPLLPINTSLTFTVTHLMVLMAMLFIRYSLHEKDAVYQFTRNLKNNYV